MPAVGVRALRDRVRFGAEFVQASNTFGAVWQQLSLPTTLVELLPGLCCYRWQRSGCEFHIRGWGTRCARL